MFPSFLTDQFNIVRFRVLIKNIFALVYQYYNCIFLSYVHLPESKRMILRTLLGNEIVVLERKLVTQQDSEMVVHDEES